MKKRALIITDSLGLPRLKPSPVLGHEVWVNILVKELNDKYDFYLATIAGLHTGMIVNNLENQMGAFSPDIIVMQVGIVDCAPRALKENERKIIERLPPTCKSIILGFIRKHYSRIVNFRNTTYITSNDFEQNIKTLKKYYSDSQFLIIPIAPANSEYQKKNPLINGSILIYNGILEKQFGDSFLKNTYCDCNIEKVYLEDNYHLSIYGNMYLASKMLEAFSQRV